MNKTKLTLNTGPIKNPRLLSAAQTLVDSIESPARVAPRHPDLFPGTVKHDIIPGMHLYFCALACVQLSVVLIPEAKILLDGIVKQLDTPICRKVSEKNLFNEAANLLIREKRYPILRLLPRILLVVPGCLLSRDFRELYKKIQNFILQVYNRDPDKPRVQATHLLRIAILHYAKFSQAGISPYEYDNYYRPLSAQTTQIRPKTAQGRKAKSKYNNAMRGKAKHTDKYYLNGARKWLLGRVICKSVSEAESKLNLDPGQLHTELHREAWDQVMGYQKGR